MKLIRRMLWFAGLLVLLAGLGFWTRPVSFFNGYLYLRLWLSGVESGSVSVAGRCIQYDALGRAGGPIVVLVHGLGGRAENWQNLSPYFAKAGYRVYMPDLPGYGRSEKPTDFSYSVPDEAAVVMGFLDALSLKQVDLGGWSMGGWIVQRVASEHPERVRRLMLFDSAGIYEVPAWDARLFTPSTIAELGQFEALLMPHPPKVPEFLSRDILRISQQNAWVIHRALATMLTGRDATDNLLPRLKMPVLIVWGTEDHVLPLSQGERMHLLIPKSQLEVFAGCGHLAPEQCASQIGPKVVEFVNQ